MSEKYQFTVILVGDSGVGKSTILCRYVSNEFKFDQTLTIGIDIGFKKISLDNGDIIKLKIFDTAGQEMFKSIARSYYKNASIVMLVCDISNELSFEHIKNWFSDVKRYASSIHLLPIIIANKSDISTHRQSVSDRNLKELATYISQQTQYKDIKIFKTSAKSGDNISKCFKYATETIYSRIQNMTTQEKRQMGINTNQDQTYNILRNRYQIENNNNNNNNDYLNCC
jgi:small GTP-binding protein